MIAKVLEGWIGIFGQIIRSEEVDGIELLVAH
jgi:hypothetical protein